MRPPIAISRAEGGSQGFSEVCLDIFSVSQSIPARTSQESIIVMRKFNYAILGKKKKKVYIYLFKRGQTRSDHSTEWDSDLYAEDQLPTLTLVQNKSLSAETKKFFFIRRMEENKMTEVVRLPNMLLCSGVEKKGWVGSLKFLCTSTQ